MKKTTIRAQKRAAGTAAKHTVGAAACLIGLLVLAECASGDLADGRTGKKSEPNKWGVEDTAKSGFMLRHDDIVWEQTNGPEGGDFTLIEINPWDPDELITGNNRRLYRSFDGG